jgi:hypothetical protein
MNIYNSIINSVNESINSVELDYADTRIDELLNTNGENGVVEDDEEFTGRCKSVIKYLEDLIKYHEKLIAEEDPETEWVIELNGMITEVLSELKSLDPNSLVQVKWNPMGALYVVDDFTKIYQELLDRFDVE